MRTETYQNDYLKMEINEEAQVRDINTFLEEVNGNRKVKLIVKAHRIGGFKRDKLGEFDWGAEEVWHEELDREMRVSKAREVNLYNIVDDIRGEILVKVKFLSDYSAENFILETRDKKTKEKITQKVKLVEVSRVEKYQKAGVEATLENLGIPFELIEDGEEYYKLFLPENANHFDIYDLIRE